jgi:hypothetical protein
MAEQPSSFANLSGTGDLSIGHQNTKCLLFQAVSHFESKQ